MHGNEESLFLPKIYCTYFPPVTKILLLLLAKATQYVVPALGTAAGDPQIASFFGRSHMTTLENQNHKSVQKN